MKLINRENTYYAYQFSCSLGGKIVMTRQEWKDAAAYLKKTHKLHDGTGTYLSFYRQLLKRDIARAVPHGKATWYNIRVPATALLAKRYRLSNYKRRNYVIEVI